MYVQTKKVNDARMEIEADGSHLLCRNFYTGDEGHSRPRGWPLSASWGLNDKGPHNIHVYQGNIYTYIIYTFNAPRGVRFSALL